MLSLGERIGLVEKNMRQCTLCPYLCGVNRMEGETGYCGLGEEGRVFYHYLSYSEEIEISPTYEIFFTGCNHRCKFCFVLDRVIEPRKGVLSPRDTIKACLQKAGRDGLKTISFVGGEPTVNLLAILHLIKFLEVPYPIVWNSNMYMAPVAHEALDGVVDTFVGDIHFGNDLCAAKVGSVSPYVSLITENFKRAASYANIIVRHLLLPGHEECCYKPIVKWLKNELPRAKFHLLTNFRPNAGSSGSILERALLPEEARRASEFAALHLSNLVA